MLHCLLWSQLTITWLGSVQKRTHHEVDIYYMLCSPPLFLNKMKNFIIFILFFITNFQNNGVLSKNRFNVIVDAKNSRIYRGPKNPKSQRDLSSFILRAKTTSIPSVKYFTGKYLIKGINHSIMKNLPT